MRKTTYFLMQFFLIILIVHCGDKGNSTRVTVDGVYSFHQITQFSISKFKRNNESLTDIRPENHEEIMRFCCDLKDKHKPATFVFFNMSDTNYSWHLCKLNTSLIENDSLRSLSFEEKLKFLQTDTTYNKTPFVKQQLPFVIETGYVYQLFGIRDLNGSLYFCLNNSGKLLVQFVDKGPW